MNIHLTDRLEEYVKTKVDSGLYNSASEVVRDALRLLEEQDQIREAKLEALRNEVRKGLDQLDRGQGIDGDKVFAKLREKAGRRKQEAR